MHANEFKIDISFVKSLITEQFPEFSMLPITQLNSVGTANYIYRLGQELYIRLPRVRDWADMEKEWKWLRYLAPHLKMKIPEPVALGQPTASYPVNWAICKWINGTNYSDEIINDEGEAAKELAHFVKELHSIDVPIDAPRSGRLPLLDLNKRTLESIDKAGDLLDRERIVKVWEASCKASAWNGTAVWIHADLLRTNLLVNSGRLTATSSWTYLILFDSLC